MTAERRRAKQSGQEIVEFGLMAVFYVPLLLGAFVTGMNLIRSIQINQACRDLDDMYIHGAYFSTYPMQQLAQRLAQGLNLQIGSSFSGNDNSNTDNGGDALVTITQIMWIGSVTSQSCAAYGAGNCTNHDSFVYTQQIQFGNGTLADSSTVTIGSPTGVSMTDAGNIEDYVIDSHAKLASAPQAAMQSLWQINTNGQSPLRDGQVVYIAEFYARSPGLSIGNLLGNAVYARYFF